MRRFLIVLVWACAAGALAFKLFTNYDYVDRLEAQAAAKVEANGLSRIWFTPAGDLAGIRRDGSAAVVSIWPVDGAAERTAKIEVGDAPFAVAEDASRAARLTPGALRVEALIASAPAQPAVERALARKAAPVSLAFTASGALAILYADGELELWDAALSRAVASTRIELTEAAPLLAKGPYLAAYSLSSNTAYVFHTGSGERLSLLEFRRIPANIVTLSLSEQARFAVATADRVEYQERAINAPGVLRAMTFYDRDRILASGDFEGIYLLGGPGPQRVAASDPGATLLAFHRSRFAFGVPGGVQIFSHKIIPVRVFRGVSTLPWWAGIAILGLISPVAVYLGFVGFKILMKRAKNTEEPVLEKREEEDESIPSALVEACRNGDCVLYTGSGLGAQAGLPTWSQFLRDLGATTGRTGPDAIAMSFASRTAELHALLSSRFLASSAASRAHLLIKEIDFPALITTSFDNLLERVFPQSGGRVYTARDCDELMRSLARREFFVLKPFGDLENPETIRLGPEQCRQVVEDNPGFAALMEDLLHTRTFLFAGADLAALERDLGLIKLTQPVTRRHFALIPSTMEGWADAARRLGLRYGIEALQYTPSSPAHPEFADFLDNLHKAMRKNPGEDEYLEKEAAHRKMSRKASGSSRK